MVIQGIHNYRPIEAAVALLPIFELVNANMMFPSVLAQSISSSEQQKARKSEKMSSPGVLTSISLSSYILAHASSVSSPRASSYAILSLKSLLTFTESPKLVAVLFEPTKHNIQLSRQVSAAALGNTVRQPMIPLKRQPTLPIQNGPRAPVCAILDCCALWLRHNLQYKLEITSYMWA